jgi:conjugal transfer pilus assembly protein TrbC
MMALCATLTGQEDNWQRADPEAILWIKRQLKADLSLKEKRDEQIPLQKCNVVVEASDPQLYVMISFSVPDEVWASLSQAMASKKAVFVLRGLPCDSFKELSRRIQRLNDLGVQAAIQINPQLFTEYQIERVPTFLMLKDSKYKKVSGNISLACAIEKMEEVW